MGDSSDMRLSYRGVQYEPTFSHEEVNEGEIRGKYRGQDWKPHYPRHMLQQQPQPYRRYRGVAYGSYVPLSERTDSSLASALNRQVCSVPLNKPTKVIANEVGQVHLDNIRRRLERRLQIAQEKGDDNLVNLLKKESQELTINL